MPYIMRSSAKGDTFLSGCFFCSSL